MIVITGATGNVGSKTAAKLLALGKKVKVIARHADKLADLKKQGAETAIGDMSDVNFLSEAFKGAEPVRRRPGSTISATISRWNYCALSRCWRMSWGRKR